MRLFGIILGAAGLALGMHLLIGVAMAVETTDIIEFCINYGGSWRCY